MCTQNYCTIKKMIGITMNHAIFNNKLHVLYCELLGLFEFCYILKCLFYKIDNYKVVRIHKADHRVFLSILSENASNEYIFIEILGGKRSRILNNYNELLF